ncbi:hypothetical protein ACLOJK_001938 [Asimina triloba]
MVVMWNLFLALLIFLDSLVPSLGVILLSITLILAFGEYHALHLAPLPNRLPIYLRTFPARRQRIGEEKQKTGEKMIIPVRCFTCGKVIGNKWDTYLDLLQADYTEGLVKVKAFLLWFCGVYGHWMIPTLHVMSRSEMLDGMFLMAGYLRKLGA